MGLSESPDSDSPKERGHRVSFGSKHRPMTVIKAMNRSTNGENMGEK